MTKLDYVGHVITLTGIVVGALIIVWQMNRQHKGALELQRKNAKEALKVELHKSLVDYVDSAVDAQSDAAMYVYMLPSSLLAFQTQVEMGMDTSPIKERSSIFSDKHFAGRNAITKLIGALESYEIVNPGLRIFRTALASAEHDVNDSQRELFFELLKVLPIDVPHERQNKIGAEVIWRSPPDREKTVELQRLIQTYFDCSLNVTTYLYDLKIEIQNTLLSGLFETRIEPRKPLDPKCVVITTEPQSVRELEKYFDEQTSWGKSKRELETKLSRSEP